MSVHHMKDLTPYAVNFSIVLVMLAAMVRKPAQKFLYQRHEHMKDAVEAALASHKKALARFSAAEKSAKAASQESAALVDREVAAAKAEAGEISQKASAEVVRLQKEAERLSQVEAEAAQERVKMDFLNLVVNQTEDDLRRGLKKDDHSAILKRAQSSIEVGV